MQQPVDLSMVLGNTLADLSWTGFTFMCALLLIGALWCVLPFAVFGVKRRLDAIEVAQRMQTELLLTELRRTNEILNKQRANPIFGDARGPRPAAYGGIHPAEIAASPRADGIVAQVAGDPAAAVTRETPRPASLRDRLDRPMMQGSAA